MHWPRNGWGRHDNRYDHDHWHDYSDNHHHPDHDHHYDHPDHHHDRDRCGPPVQDLPQDPSPLAADSHAEALMRGASATTPAR
jgi:hypothetical protein